MSTDTIISNETRLKNQGGVPYKGSQTLGKDDFLKLLVAQLKYQDPLKPLEDKEFIAQMAQFSSLEQMQNLGKLQENLIRESIVGQAINLIGRTVDALDPETNEVFTGKVSAMKMVGGQPKLIIGDKEVDMGYISKVTL
ncbi:MAG: hypothetical protein M0Z31_03360 [Clostridia bacterium]|nr:hypothetical protein [Clostridia bacterium]